MKLYFGSPFEADVSKRESKGMIAREAIFQLGMRHKAVSISLHFVQSGHIPELLAPTLVPGPVPERNLH